jgi:orotate phosphoribosyltransferase
MQMPSGKFFGKDDLELLKLMVECGFIQRRDTPFKLKSGVMSHVYVFGREDITDHPYLEWLIGLKIARLVEEYALPGDTQPCLIGIPTAGTPLSTGRCDGELC